MTTFKMLLPLWALAGAPCAADAQSYVIYGKGTDTCEQFLVSVQGSPLGQTATLKHFGRAWYADSLAYTQWFEGYISALNALNAGRQIETDFATADGWVRNWCAGNPGEKFEAAVGSFVVSKVQGK